MVVCEKPIRPVDADSLTWLLVGDIREMLQDHLDREAINFLCAGRAALLQLAHPFVAHAIDQHSDTRRDPLRRFRRTFAFVYSMIFGSMDHAFACARRVHRIHERIHGNIAEDVGAFTQGSPYEANDEEALYWVYATLHVFAITGSPTLDVVVRSDDNSGMSSATTRW